MKLRTADSTIYKVTWQSAFWVERQAHVTKSTFHWPLGKEHAWPPRRSPPPALLP